MCELHGNRSPIEFVFLEFPNPALSLPIQQMKRMVGIVTHTYPNMSV